MSYYTKADLPAGTILLTKAGGRLEVASDEYHHTKKYGEVWLTKGTYLNLDSIGPGAYADIYERPPLPKPKGFAGWIQKVETQ